MGDSVVVDNRARERREKGSGHGIILETEHYLFLETVSMVGSHGGHVCSRNRSNLRKGDTMIMFIARMRYDEGR